MPRYIYFKLSLFIFIFSSLPLIPAKSALETNAIEQKEINRELKSQYLLGAGDALSIRFPGLSFYGGSYEIKPDGYLYLPEIGKVDAKGQTLKELTDILNKKYEEFIYDPQISITIDKFRPIKVTLRGEVNVSGLFYFRKDIEEDKTYTQPKVFDLLRNSKGFTTEADLSNVIITRKNSKSQGGGKLKTTLNILSLIEEGDQSQNIDLYDEDDVFVSKSDSISLKTFNVINKSNITPNTIQVFINGNVSAPGEKTIIQGKSLFEAISAAGGVSPLTGDIEFIRINENGQNEKRIIKLSSYMPKGSKNNPILISGDIILVKRNLFGRVSSVLNEYTAPIINSFGIYKILDD